jgi:hypothetical protein
VVGQPDQKCQYKFEKSYDEFSSERATWWWLLRALRRGAEKLFPTP